MSCFMEPLLPVSAAAEIARSIYVFHPSVVLFLSDRSLPMTDKASADCRMEANYACQQELDLIPLMMTDGFKLKGWLGLILGTRMWYAFWGADADDDASFDRRLDSVVREIGDRGKTMLPEAVPPFPEPTLEPAPAPAPAVSRAPAQAPAPTPVQAPVAPSRAALIPATVATPGQSFTPTMQMVSPTPQLQLHGGTTGNSLTELSVFMREQHQMLMEREGKIEARMESERQETKAKLEQQEAKIEQQRQEMEAKMEHHRQETERQRQENATLREQQREEIEQLREQAKPQLARDTVSEEQLGALQLRLEVLHEARLLTDEELNSLEDAVVDCIELLPTAFATERGVDKVIKMILVSERVGNDKTLARQLKRKFA